MVMTNTIDYLAEDDRCHYAFVDDDDNSAATGNEVNLIGSRLNREDSSRTMFTFATAEEIKGANPPGPPGKHSNRNQSEPPGRYLGRMGRRTTSPCRRRSSSPLPLSRYHPSQGPLTSLSSRRSSGRLSPTNSGDEAVEKNTVKAASNETKRQSIESFLERTLPVLSEESSKTKPAAPNPVAVLITDVIRKCDPSGHQMDDHYDRDPTALQLFPSKLRKYVRSTKPRTQEQTKSEFPASDLSSSKQCNPTPMSEAVLAAIRTRKTASREADHQVDTGSSGSSSATPLTPNPVATLISEALTKKGTPTTDDLKEAGQAKSSHLSKTRRESRSRKKSSNEPALFADAKVAHDPRQEVDVAKWRSGSRDVPGGGLGPAGKSELESVKSPACKLKEVEKSSEFQRIASSKARDRPETSERRRDSSPSKRPKSKTKEDLPDQAMPSSSEKHRNSPGKPRQKRNSSEGRQDARTTRSPRSKDSLYALLSESPRRQLRRRNSTGSVNTSEVPMSSSVHRSGSRQARPQTRSPPRARSPVKATTPSRERVASALCERTASSSRERGDRSLRDRRAVSTSRERATTPSRERVISPSRDCFDSPSRERARREKKGTMQAMHMSLSNLTRNPRRSSRHRTKSDDKNAAKPMHMSLSCLFESSSPPRSRSNSRSMRITRSTSFDLDKSPTKRSSSHRRSDALSPIQPPRKSSSEAKTSGSDSKGRSSRSTSPSGREPKSRQAPSASRLQRNKERSSSLKVPKTAPTRPRRSVSNLHNFTTLSLDDEDDDDNNSINLEQLGTSSHTTSLQLDISNPCLVETMLVASMLTSNTDSSSELSDNDLFKAADLRNAQSTHTSAVQGTSKSERSSRSKTRTSLMSSLRDLSPRRVRADRTSDNGMMQRSSPQPWFPQLETLF
jgi:hypothetical protein